MTTVYVSGLSPNDILNDIAIIFRRFGSYEEGSPPRMVGRVVVLIYTNPEAAANAVRSNTGPNLRVGRSPPFPDESMRATDPERYRAEQQLWNRWADSNDSFSEEEEDSVPSGARVLIGNLAPDVTNVDLIPIITRPARATAVQMHRDLGRATIYYENIGDARNAAREMEGRDINGREVEVVSVAETNVPPDVRAPSPPRNRTWEPSPPRARQVTPPRFSTHQFQQDSPRHEPSNIQSRRYLTVEDTGSLMQSGELVRFVFDPQNQREVPAGLTRLTFIGVDGTEYDVLTRYDPQTNQIFPPS